MNVSSVRRLSTINTFSTLYITAWWMLKLGRDMKCSWCPTRVVVFRPDPPSGGSRAGKVAVGPYLDTLL